LLTAALAPRKVKIIKNGLDVFEREENLLQNGILKFAFRYKAKRQESQIYACEKATFRKGDCHLKGP